MKITNVMPFLAALGIASCDGAGAEAEAPELAGGAITLWSDSTELFMEHPALIVGDSGRFAVHLTDLTDFAPLRSGSVTLRFHPRDGGAPVVATQDNPRAPGIFGASPRFTRPGVYDLTLLVHSPQARDSLTIPGLRVYPSAAEAPVDSAGAESGISFLKEQQWKTTGFRTAFAVEGSLPGTIEAPATVVAAAGAHVDVSAPVTGVIDATAGPQLVAGTRVSAGHVLAVLAPLLGESGSAVAEARARLAEAEDEFARVTRLLAAEAVPERRAHEARIRLQAAKESLSGLGGDSGRIVIRAPISGVVTARRFVPGGRLAAGTPLFSIVDASRVWIAGSVPAADATALSGEATASFQAEGVPGERQAGRLVSVGAVLDSVTRTLPVVFEADNADGRIKVGALARIAIRTASRVTGVILPASAVLDAEGRSVVFVQAQGETFERREVEVRGRDAGRVVVVGALRPGERVVTGATYQVRLAALSTGAPMQGHVH